MLATLFCSYYLVVRSKLILDPSKAIVLYVKIKYTKMIKPLIVTSVSSGVTINELAFLKLLS